MKTYRKQTDNRIQIMFLDWFERCNEDEEIEYKTCRIAIPVPKVIRENTNKYLNSPYDMDLVSAFRKAANEYKRPSKKLRDALAKDNFRKFIPDAYPKKNEKFVKRCTSEYSFKRYKGQKLKTSTGIHEVSKVEHYYTIFKDGTIGTPYDTIPVDKKEQVEMLKVELEYNRWRINYYENMPSSEKNVVQKNIEALEYKMHELYRELAEEM
jgi:hypothetical protein